MCSEEFALTWDDHHNTLVGVFEKLLDRNSLVDCTIAAEGQYLKAHKLVLSACSPYFEMLFTQENEKNPIIILKDIKFQELKAMIDFMYRGRVKIPEDRLGDFVDAAESLQIKGLGGDPKKNDSRNVAKETTVLRKRNVRVSPIPRKRRKNSCSSDDGQNTVNLSVGSEIDDESNSYESVPHRLRQEQSPHAVSATSHTSLCSVQDELCSSQSKSLSSFVQPTECHVKTEPEHVPDVIVPDRIFVVEPKIEECDDVASVAATSEVVQERMAGNMHSQESGNQYNVYPHLLATAEMGSSDSFHAVQGVEHSNLQAFVPTLPIPHGMADDSLLMPQVDEFSSIQGSGDCENEESGLPQRRLGNSLGELVSPVSSSVAVREPASADAAAAVETRKASRRSLKRHSCPRCLKAFHTLSNLQRHLRVHTGEKPFQCRECGKAFGDKSVLTIHLRLHTGEKPFKCEACGEQFTFRNQLSRHEYTHWGYLTHRCNVCPARFFEANSLIVHMRIHSGEKPYFCDQCPKTFKTVGHLRGHTQRVHGSLVDEPSSLLTGESCKLPSPDDSSLFASVKR